MTSILKQYKITDKAAWREFLLHNHPDKGGNPDVFMTVKSAYEAHGPQPVESMRRELFGDAYKLFEQHVEKMFATSYREPLVATRPRDHPQCVFITKQKTQCRNNAKCGMFCSRHTKKHILPPVPGTEHKFS
jgi:hypothetical protein